MDVERFLLFLLQVTVFLGCGFAAKYREGGGNFSVPLQWMLGLQRLRQDAIWLAKVAERGMARPSFIPPKPIRRLRDLTRYRRTLTHDRTREKQRLEKILEDAQIKLSAVARDILGVSSRAMIEALIAGQRDPKVLAQLAKGRMRIKISALQEALTGHFDDHHAFVCQIMLDNIDRLCAQIDNLTTRIEELIAPFQHQVDQLDEIPGVGRIGAQDILAEIGVDMTVFPTDAHLVSWAKFAPQIKESAGKRKGSSTTGQGNPWLGGALGEAATGAARSPTFLAARYKRIAKRRGTRRALVAVGHSILTIAWHLLSDHDAHFVDLGADWHTSRINPEQQTRNLVRQLQRLGHTVTLEPAA